MKMKSRNDLLKELTRQLNWAKRDIKKWEYQIKNTPKGFILSVSDMQQCIARDKQIIKIITNQLNKIAGNGRKVENEEDI